MERNVDILVAQDDAEHTDLIKTKLSQGGIKNRIIHFKNGREVLNFLFKEGDAPHREEGKSYLLVLDIHLPLVNGLDVLSKLKEDKKLCKLPVIIFTNSEKPGEIELCHKLGCSNYIVKPVKYDSFVTVIDRLGLFISVLQVPGID